MPRSGKKPAGAGRPLALSNPITPRRSRGNARRPTSATGARETGRAPKALEGGESADGHGRQHWGGPPLPAQPPPFLHFLAWISAPLPPPIRPGGVCTYSPGVFFSPHRYARGVFSNTPGGCLISERAHLPADQRADHRAKKNPACAGINELFQLTRRICGGRRDAEALCYGISTLYYRGGLMSKSVIKKRAAALKATPGYRI